MRRLLMACLTAAGVAGFAGACFGHGSSTTVTTTGLIWDGVARTSHAPRRVLSKAEQDLLSTPPLVAETGATAATNAGRRVVGEPLVGIAVRHGLTGVLKTPAQARRWMAQSEAIPAGQAVYGVPMGGPDGPGIVWCAPHAETAGKDGAAHWSAVCLPFGDVSHVWTEARPAMMPVDLAWDDRTARRASAPDVEIRPAALQPMRFSYVFGGWNARGWAVIEARLDWGEGPQLLRALAIPPDADGATKLKLLGSEMVLRRGAGATAPAEVTVEVRTPPSPGAPIIY